MTDRIAAKRTAVRSGVTIAYAVLLPFAASGADDLDTVLHTLAQQRHAEASFVEQHFLALLKRPTESFGELEYDAPDRLEKRTLEPRAEDLLAVGNTLTITKGHGRHVVDLQTLPQALPFIEAMRATLAGDRAALERLFRLDFAGDFERWHLVLVPGSGQLVHSVSQITIDGSRAALLRVEIRQSDGDRSVTTLRAHSNRAAATGGDAARER